MQDIINELDEGVNLTKSSQAVLWRFCLKSVFRGIPRPVFREIQKRGTWIPTSQMAPQHIKTFLLVPPQDDSFGSFITFVARFRAVNPYWSPAEEVVRKAWSLSLYHYGLSPSITAATTASDSMWCTPRMETYWSKVHRSAVGRIAYPDLEPLIEEYLEDNYFLVDEELYIIPLVRSAAYEEQDPFVEWAESYKKENIQLGPSQVRITDEFTKHMKVNHQVDDAWIIQALSTTEAQQFWADNVTLCIANTTPPNNRAVTTLQSQIGTLSGDVALRDATIGQLQSQNGTLMNDVATRDATISQLQNMVTQLQQDVAGRDQQMSILHQQVSTFQQQQVQTVDLAAHNTLLQEVQFLRRFRDATSMTAGVIMGSLSDLSNEFYPPS